MEFSKVKLKGKSESNKVVTACLAYIKEEYQNICSSNEVLLQVMGPILESKFTGQFVNKINQ